MDKERVAESRTPAPVHKWTSVDEYFAALARRRTARRSREPQQRRTQPETPRFALSTLPFLTLLIALAVLAVLIIIAAWPGSQPPPKPKPPEQQEKGVARKGWLQEAEKEFH